MSATPEPKVIRRCIICKHPRAGHPKIGCPNAIVIPIVNPSLTAPTVNLQATISTCVVRPRTAFRTLRLHKSTCEYPTRSSPPAAGLCMPTSSSPNPLEAKSRWDMTMKYWEIHQSSTFQRAHLSQTVKMLSSVSHYLLLGINLVSPLEYKLEGERIYELCDSDNIVPYRLIGQNEEPCLVFASSLRPTDPGQTKDSPPALLSAEFNPAAGRRNTTSGESYGAYEFAGASGIPSHVRDATTAHPRPKMPCYVIYAFFWHARALFFGWSCLSSYRRAINSVAAFPRVHLSLSNNPLPPQVLRKPYSTSTPPTMANKPPPPNPPRRSRRLHDKDNSNAGGNEDQHATANAPQANSQQMSGCPQPLGANDSKYKPKLKLLGVFVPPLKKSSKTPAAEQSSAPPPNQAATPVAVHQVAAQAPVQSVQPPSASGIVSNALKEAVEKAKMGKVNTNARSAQPQASDQRSAVEPSLSSDDEDQDGDRLADIFAAGTTADSRKVDPENFIKSRLPPPSESEADGDEEVAPSDVEEEGNHDFIPPHRFAILFHLRASASLAILCTPGTLSLASDP
ncbi:hypothetical protein NMY22_g18898 [Coprinellus aureogranulatus]|nr:hypothetical protein NMY22_g18898 [Coprinellus aureogranulatus]